MVHNKNLVEIQWYENCYRTVRRGVITSCGRVVRDFESEVKTNDNVQGLRSKFIKEVVDPLFFVQKNYEGLLFYQ